MRTDAVISIEADPGLCWTAIVGAASQEGCGPMSFPVTDSLGLFSSSVQKADDKTGLVTITVLQDGVAVAENSTSAKFGIAMVIVEP